MLSSRALRFVRRSWDTIVVAIVVATWLAASRDLGRVAAWIPRIVLGITLALVAVQLVLEFREIRPDTDPWTRDRLPPLRRGGPLVVVLWILALMIATLVFGTAPGSAVFCAAYLRWHAGERWVTSTAVGAALGTIVWLIFDRLLGAALYPGWAWRWLT